MGAGDLRFQESALETHREAEKCSELEGQGRNL